MSASYFDHNATTPLSNVAKAAWIEVAERFWHNPSSLYPEAGAAKRRLEDAREQLADLLGAEDEPEIIFTSGATEGNNATLRHLAAANPTKRCAVSAIEHPSVLAPARREFGDRLLEMGVGRSGVIELDKLKATLDGGDIAAVSVMAANNETGVLQPVDDIYELCAASGAVFHCDAAQCHGKTVQAPRADIVVGSAHKFGGPKGVGFLQLNGRAQNLISQTGGPQEERRRAGTEDLAGIVAMVAALSNPQDWSPQGSLRDAFEQRLGESLDGLSIAGGGAARLPNTAMIFMPCGKNLKWLTRLGRRGFSVSTGSACSSGAESGSHVLAAMACGPEEIDRALRISSGPDSTAADWRSLEEAILEVSAEFASEGGKGKPTLDLGNL